MHALGRYVTIGLLAAGLLLSVAGLPASAADAVGSTAVPTPVGRPRPPIGPGDPAPLVDHRPDLLHGLSLRQIYARAARSLARTAAEHYGPWTAAKAAATGQSNYFVADSVEVYAVRPLEAGDHSFVFVPAGLGYEVTWAGDITPPEEFLAPEGAEAVTAQGADPIFGGPWGTESISWSTYYSEDDGGVFCTTTRGENRTKWLRRILTDRSSYWDFRGISQTAVAEITTGGSCDDFIDYFVIGARSTNSSSQWVDQSPLSDYTGGCGETTLSIGGSYGYVNASVSQVIRRCEKWDVQGGNAESGTTWYSIHYDNNGSTSNESRESAAIAVLRIREGSLANWQFSNGLDVDNT